MTTFVRSLLILAGVIACGGDGPCLALPCPEPFALTLTVTSATSGVAVTNAVVSVSSAIVTTEPCAGECFIPGTAGTYKLDVSAPGFVSVHREIQVTGTDPKCGCPSADTQHVAIALNPVS
jgi:hypothetical protein